MHPAASSLLRPWLCLEIWPLAIKKDFSHVFGLAWGGEVSLVSAGAGFGGIDLWGEWQQAAFIPAVWGSLLPMANPRWALPPGVKFSGQKLGRRGERRSPGGTASCVGRVSAGGLPTNTLNAHGRKTSDPWPCTFPCTRARFLLGTGRCRAGAAPFLEKQGSASLWLY